MKPSTERIEIQKRILKKLRKVAFWCGCALLFGGLILYFILKPYYQEAMQYDLAKLSDYDVTTIFYDRNGEEIGRLFLEDRMLLTREQIPLLLRQAVIATEDRGFYQHHGINTVSILRATLINLKNLSKKQGGSTITQQLAKHLIGNFERTFHRKLVEAFLAHAIEKNFTKEEILTFYLNRIYLGKGCFGMSSAAKGYFGKSVAELSVSECALLASIIKAPTSYSPRNNMEKAIFWRNRTLLSMRDQNYISDEEEKRAKASTLDLAPINPALSHGRVNTYFMAMVTKELDEDLAIKEEDEASQGLRVYTTLDLQLQKQAEIETIKKLNEVELELKKRPENQSTGAAPLQAAALVADLHTGAIRCVVGGRDFDKSPFNRATMAHRENGALLHPFLYALALERLHLNPASMMDASFLSPANEAVSEEISLENPRHDFSKRLLTLQDALAFSNKACALRVGLQVGVPVFAQWLTKAGAGNPASELIESAKAIQPLSMLKILSLYQLLGNGGVQAKPYTIESVLNTRNQLLYQAGHPATSPLIPPLIARQMTLTLQAVVREGTANSLLRDHAFPVPVVGMTGYSEGYRDSWFVGYTPSLVAGVWVGFDESIPIGNKMIATHTALPLWSNIMQRAIQLNPIGETFLIPKELKKVEINRRTGTVRGQGFLTPSTGAIFVYLNQQQLGTLEEEIESKGEDPKRQAWSDWLGTMINHSDEDIPLNDQSPDEKKVIPAVAEYRIPGLRGNILASQGQPLATMIQGQNLVLSWPAAEVAVDDEDVLRWVKTHLVLAENWLGKKIDLSDSELRSHYQFQRFHPLTVFENLSPDQVERFSSSPLIKNNFSLQGIPKRAYPQGSLFSHGIGYLRRTQGPNHRQYQAEEVLYNDYEGASGLEEIFENSLKGKEGALSIVTTAEGFAQKAMVTQPASVGLNLRTTIDLNIQSAVEKSMEPIRTGAIVILNVNNGDIVAMASKPNFDPNDFIPALLPEKWEAFVKAKKNPLIDRSYRQSYPPGSTFKVITSIAAMQANVFDDDRIVNCPGYYQVANITFRFPRETKSISYVEALSHSYNTYFMDLGLRTGRKALIDAAQSLGVGRSTGIILQDENIGIMPDPDYMKQIHHRTLGLGDLANCSIGQGDVLVTPLQMANWMAAIANEGTLYQPRLVSQIEEQTGKSMTSFPPKRLNQISFPVGPLAALKKGLVSTVKEGTGTSAQVSGISVAGKTGTAQVGSKIQPRQIAWFEGYLPAGHPLYSFAVMIEGDVDQDLHGGTDTGPIVSQIFSKIYNRPAITPQKEN